MCDANFSSNMMDGKLKVINPASLLQKENESKLAQLASSPFGQNILPVVPEEYFVECGYAVMDSEYIQTHRDANSPLEEFFVTGLDDGTVHTYAYTKNKECSYKRRVIK